jgi:hypothetical protein
LLLPIIGLDPLLPQVEHNLSGAGWQADRAPSVTAHN